MPGLLTVPTLEGWSFAAEGAAIFEAEATAVVADVHLGYEWSRGSGGDCLPAHSLAETVAKLESLISRRPLRRLIVAGDLVESASPCVRTSRDARALRRWLADRAVEFVELRGNHDPPRRPPLAESHDLGGWSIRHGDRPIGRGRVVFGHHHPSLKAEGLSAPCFLVGPSTIALPAFSPNAAGLDVASPSLPEAFRREPLRCVAAIGAAILDFGPLAELVAKLRGPIGR